LVRNNRPELKDLMDTPPWDWPDDAGKRFHAVLVDRKASPSDRLVAAQLAGDFVVVDDELCDALMNILESADEPERLRAAAAISLGPVLEHADTFEFDDPDDVPITEETFDRIRSLLQRLYLDNSVAKLVRRRILEGSVRSPMEWHREAISQAYTGDDRDWRLTAVFAMRWVRGFNDQILEALQSDDPEIECEAVQAAGNWELDPAWDHVAALAGDSATPRSTRLAAIEAVGSIRPAEAREILTELADDDDEEIAEAAEEALMMVDAQMEADFDDEDDEEDEDETIH
jgi:HEAT repeat protein